MKHSSDNTNEKNIGQVSENNPGWAGKGVPTFKSLLLKTLRSSKTNLFKADFNLLLNDVRANGKNMYAFVIRKNQKNVICPCCNWSGPAFITTCNSKRLNHNSNCPICDSRSRHRGLSTLLVRALENKELTLLFFAPEKILLSTLNADLANIKVETTDYYSTDVDFPNEDIQNLTFNDESFDYLLCNHVIEHVPNDDLAFSEVSRILKKDGKAIITIPGNYNLQYTEEFEKTDSNGHFRHYGIEVVDKMKSYFSKVEVIDLHTVSKPEYGVRKMDLAFVCIK